MVINDPPLYTHTTLISMETINVGHTKFMVKVDMTWVQDLESPPHIFMKTSNQHIETKVAQSKLITCIHFLGYHLIWPTLIFYRKFNCTKKSCGSHYIPLWESMWLLRKLLWPTIIRLFSALEKLITCFGQGLEFQLWWRLIVSLLY